MKYSFILTSLIIIIITSCKSKIEEPIFNGKDLSNWTFFLKTPANPDSVFSVVDSMIQITGQPFGYMRSKKEYSNYKLHLEYRWLSTPANSGIFLHVKGEDKIWPLCYECQLMNSRAGDIILMGVGMGLTVKDSVYSVQEGKKNIVSPKFDFTNEKPAGEWNSIDITCNEDNIEIIFNGLLQNKGSGLTSATGAICLQSEGGPIQFRNIYLRSLGLPVVCGQPETSQ